MIDVIADAFYGEIEKIATRAHREWEKSEAAPTRPHPPLVEKRVESGGKKGPRPNPQLMTPRTRTTRIWTQEHTPREKELANLPPEVRKRALELLAKKRASWPADSGGPSPRDIQREVVLRGGTKYLQQKPQDAWPWPRKASPPPGVTLTDLSRGTKK